MFRVLKRMILCAFQGFQLWMEGLILVVGGVGGYFSKGEGKAGKIQKNINGKTARKRRQYERNLEKIEGLTSLP